MDVTERSVCDVPIAVERRRRGRPPLAENDPSCDLTLTIEGSLYDRLYRRAADRRMTVPEFIRALLRSAAI